MFKPQGTTPRDHDSHDADVARLTAYLETALGCTDVVLTKERRWRPVWHASMMRNGKPAEMLLKGERTWLTHPYPLDYEMLMQRTLHENGIPIPAILGFCPEPCTIVMEWVRGGRDPGLMQQAIENPSEMTPDRWQASLRYMEILADMHDIPCEKFVAAGAQMPTNSQQLALGNFELFDAMRGLNGLSDPFMTFFSGWLRRNYPKQRSTVSFLTGDCGQFLSDGPEVTCILDVEIGHLGDPMRDLACYRGRHPIENMGDVPALFLHYEKASGKPLDYDVIAFHTVAFLCEAYYGPYFGLHDLGRGGDWVESVVQVAVIARRALEALGEITGVTFDAIALPEPASTPLEDLAFAKLIAELDRLTETKGLQDWQRNVIVSVPHYLRNRGHYQSWSAQADIAETAALTAKQPSTLVEADAVLTTYIKSVGPEQDAALVRLFHRRFLRQCLIIAGPNPSPDHIALSPMEPILGQKS
jgi:hypothetical protein